MSRDITIGTILGLNNRLPPTRMETVLPSSAKAAWLRVASNIDLTANGFIRRRQGYVRAAAGGWHSLWSDRQGAYGVRDGDLIRIDRRMASTGGVPAVGHGRVSYARLPDGMVYWTNGARIGRLDGTAARAGHAHPQPCSRCRAHGGRPAAGALSGVLHRVGRGWRVCQYGASGHHAAAGRRYLFFGPGALHPHLRHRP